MNSDEIRDQYFKFWTSEPRNSKQIPNVSLVPNVDSTLLFTNSGMFPLVPYLAGQPHPLGKRLCNFQRCLRTNYDEMLEIGDNRHTLMFEMMGDWSIGDFSKEQQIPWILELLVEKFKIDPSRLYVSVFGGDEIIPRDDVAINSWKKAFAKYGIAAEFSEDITNIPSDLTEGKTFTKKIFPYGRKKNWWQRGEAVGELGGPSSEIFYDLGKIERQDEKFHINDDSGRFIEIGNNVFMEYFLDKDMTWQPLPQKNIDFGGGFERIVMCLQGKNDIFETDIYQPILDTISKISGRQYKTNNGVTEDTSCFRIIADHGRAATFILADGVKPSNKDQGYILRRFIRRMVRFAKKLGIDANFTHIIAQAVIDRMKSAYPQLEENKATILEALSKEENVFRQTLSKGLKEIEKIKLTETSISGEKAFYIYETYGFPIELTLDEFPMSESEKTSVIKDFKQKETEHREQSKLGADKKFKGGLADQSIEVIKLHTTHHLLLKALQTVVSQDIKQKGSNITSERLRIDFNYKDKLSDQQISEVENMVNEQISKKLNVERQELPITEAEKLNAEKEFGQKYPEIVSVYFIKNSDGSNFSIEFCGGPHVNNTGEIGENGKKFKILKQENIGSGIRRIKAALV
jgi:alanyl-tRNA synthetase